MMNNKPSINLEFVKVAKSMRDAQKEAPYSQRAQRRAQSLGLLFDTKLEAIEKELAKAQQADKQQLPLFER